MTAIQPHDIVTMLPLSMMEWMRCTLEVLGAIFLVLIILFLLLCLTMIPDFFRYLKIKSM